MSQLELLEAEALKLSAGERASFATWLLESLEPDEEWERDWAVELARRSAEVESGQAKLLPADEVFARLRAQFQ